MNNIDFSHVWKLFAYPVENYLNKTEYSNFIKIENIYDSLRFYHTDSCLLIIQNRLHK